MSIHASAHFVQPIPPSIVSLTFAMSGGTAKTLPKPPQFQDISFVHRRRRAVRSNSELGHNSM